MATRRIVISYKWYTYRGTGATPVTGVCLEPECCLAMDLVHVFAPDGFLFLGLNVVEKHFLGSIEIRIGYPVFHPVCLTIRLCQVYCMKVVHRPLDTSQLKTLRVHSLNVLPHCFGEQQFSCISFRAELLVCLIVELAVSIAAKYP